MSSSVAAQRNELHVSETSELTLSGTETVHQLPSAACILDSEGRMIAVNRLFVRIMEAAAPDAFFGRAFGDCVFEGDLVRLVGLEQTFAEGAESL